jgi:hypothetical protein
VSTCAAIHQEDPRSKHARGAREHCLQGAGQDTAEVQRRQEGIRCDICCAAVPVALYVCGAQAANSQQHCLAAPFKASCWQWQCVCSESSLAHTSSNTKTDDCAAAYDRKKYTWKLLYSHMMGYEVDFGHKQAADLIPSARFDEKQVGYQALTILLNEVCSRSPARGMSACSSLPLGGRCTPSKCIAQVTALVWVQVAPIDSNANLVGVVHFGT